MRFIKKISLLLAIILILPVCACKKAATPVTFTAFNTQVIVAGQSKPVTKNVENKIKNLCASLENEFDAKKDGSLVKEFNEADGGATINVSDTAFEILTAAKTVYDSSGGKFDPTVYPLVSLWGFAPYSYKPEFTPPTADQINTELLKVNFKSVLLDAENSTITKTDEITQLDLGGIVKGYAADKVSQILIENGYSDGYVSVGGSSLYLLNVKELSIRHPRNVTDIILTVNCNDKTNLSVSTSGDYEKYHVGVDGTRYCHIIDPDTGKPATTGVASATLIGIDGAIGDALTTALCLCDYTLESADNGLIRLLSSVINEYPECSVYVVYDNGTEKRLITNKTQGDDFTLRDDEYIIVNI
ncbi:MAG: FAD:protein FMN transferase [Clostridia bacterium]|nr:FAD:protein FMN transferase [Clostridia bacterium]